MMRTDVKIGFAVGGVLLAVLIVYLLATSPTHGPGEVTLVPDSTTTTNQNTLPEALDGTAGSVAAVPAEQQRNDPFAPTASDDSQEGTSPSAGSDGTNGSSEDRWQRALNTGRVDAENVPLLMIETTTPSDAVPSRTSSQPPTQDAPMLPTVDPVSGDPPANPRTDTPIDSTDTGATGVNPDVNTNPVLGSPGPGAGTSPSTQSASASHRTHVIQPGETFASIAAAIYGNSAYYPHIMRANPSVNPKRLRPGTTIVLPAESEVTARSSAQPAGAQLGGAATDATPLDPTRQYRVQTGDSLYKIAVRLYGRADKLDAIYDLNKDTIGPNRSHLKVGMILKLPEPPNSATASGQ